MLILLFQKLPRVIFLITRVRVNFFRFQKIGTTNKYFLSKFMGFTQSKKIYKSKLLLIEKDIMVKQKNRFPRLY